MVFVPAADFELKSGDDMLSVYRFNSETIAHKFCRTCGIESFAEGTSRDGSATIMVNVNCLDGVDPRALTAHHFDGRSV